MAIDPNYETWKKRAQERKTDVTAVRYEAMNGVGQGVNAASTAFAKYDFRLEGIVETTLGFSTVCGILAVLEAKKGKRYAASCFKRGDAGMWSHIDRKRDRLEQALFFEQKGLAGSPEGDIEQLADLAVYSIKWLTERMETQPEEFVKFVQRIRDLE
jgi:hypothetical protein